MSDPATQSTPSPAAPALRRPEVLAPAGDWDCVHAAVENGADAVYFGLDRFNARMRAHNFTAADLPELMRFLHRRGVRGYVTFNVLVFSNEIAEAADYIRAAMARSAPEFAPALYEEYDYVTLLRASLDRDIEAQKEQNEAQSVIDELIRLRDAGEAEGRYYSREQLERYRTEVAPYLIFPSCGYVDGWTPANSYMKGKLDMDGLIAELNNR